MLTPPIMDHIAQRHLIAGFDDRIKDYFWVSTFIKFCIKVYSLNINVHDISNISIILHTQVCKSHPKVLSSAIVEEMMDRQSTAFAQRAFCEDVEKVMRMNGDHSTANFVRTFRRWYEAIDAPGIPSAERIQRFLEMRDHLLNKPHRQRFDTFPPPGTHIKGFSLTWYEGMLHNIDTRLQLYGLLPGYCQRSIGTLAAESFFGDLTEMDQTKLGCPKAIHIPRLISTVTEINHYRHNPDERYTFLIFGIFLCTVSKIIVINDSSMNGV